MSKFSTLILLVIINIGMRTPAYTPYTLQQSFTPTVHQLGRSGAMIPNVAYMSGWNTPQVHIMRRKNGQWAYAEILAPYDRDSLTGSKFGDAMAVTPTGDTLVVGDHAKSAIYIYHRGFNVQKISQGSGNSFGFSVAISGSTIVVGAQAENTNRGSAYVYIKNGGVWAHQQTLTAFDGTTNDLFGASVGISGDTIAVGANLDDNSKGTDAGAVYIYHRVGTSWTVSFKLLASDGAASDQFGKSMHMRGNYLMVAAPAKNSNKGALYIYHRESYEYKEQANIVPSQGIYANYQVAFDTESDNVNLLAVGSYDNNNGRVWVYSRNGTVWTLRQNLVEPSRQWGSHFGSVVGIACDSLFVVGVGYSRRFFYSNGECVC